MQQPPRGFSVRIEAGIQDGDGDGEMVVTGSQRQKKRLPDAKPLEGVTISDAGIVRGPRDGDEPSRRRTPEQLSEARAVLKENPRYQLARAVAGVLARNVEDVLERDVVIDTAVPETELRLPLVQLSTGLFLPADYSLALIIASMDQPRRAAYTASNDKAQKIEMLKDACSFEVSRKIHGQQQGGALTAAQVDAYAAGIEREISGILQSNRAGNFKAASSITPDELKRLVRLVHDRTVVEIGRLGDGAPIQHVAYEDLPGGIDLATLVGRIDTVPSGNLVSELNKWDTSLNAKRLQQARDNFDDTNMARINFRTVDRFDIGGRGRVTPNPLYGYPKARASLPELSRQVRFSPALSTALEQALEDIRAILGLSWNEFGTNDAVEFHSEMASPGVEILYTRYVGFLIRKGELLTPRRPESVKEVSATVEYEISKALLELQAGVQQWPRSRASGRQRPFYALKSEGAPQAGPAVTDDTMYGVPLVRGGTKKQRPDGEDITGGQILQRVSDGLLLSRFNRV